MLRRGADRFLTRLLDHLGPGLPIEVAIPEAIVFAVRESRSEPSLALVFSPDQVGRTASLPGAWTALYEQALAVLGPGLDWARSEASCAGAHQRGDQSSGCCGSCSPS